MTIELNDVGQSPDSKKLFHSFVFEKGEPFRSYALVPRSKYKYISSAVEIVVAIGLVMFCSYYSCSTTVCWKGPFNPLPTKFVVATVLFIGGGMVT